MVSSVVERKIMSLLINSRNDLAKRNSVDALVVSPASVWDVDRYAPRAARGSGDSRYIRTLRVEDRTTYRSNRVESGGCDSLSQRAQRSAVKSNTGNYVLGGVFGIAVFLGTLLGGLAGTEGSSAPQPPTSDIQQVEAAVVH